MLARPVLRLPRSASWSQLCLLLAAAVLVPFSCPPVLLRRCSWLSDDDPAALTALLDQLGAPAAVRSALAAKGFSSLSSLAFALADPSDPAQVKLFLKALLGLPDDDDSGFVSADASCVRRLLLEASSLAPARPANPSAAGPSLPSPGSSAEFFQVAAC